MSLSRAILTVILLVILIVSYGLIATVDAGTNSFEFVLSLIVFIGFVIACVWVTVWRR